LPPVESSLFHFRPTRPPLQIISFVGMTKGIVFPSHTKPSQIITAILLCRDSAVARQMAKLRRAKKGTPDRF